MIQPALNDLRIFSASKLRLLEQKRAKGDIQKIQEINQTSDDEINRKWLWMTAISGGPVCFLLIPFVLSILQPFLWPWLAMSLWIVAKCLMVAVFLIFLLAAFFTHHTSS